MDFRWKAVRGSRWPSLLCVVDQDGHEIDTVAAISEPEEIKRVYLIAGAPRLFDAACRALALICNGPGDCDDDPVAIRKELEAALQQSLDGKNEHEGINRVEDFQRPGTSRRC